MKTTALVAFIFTLSSASDCFVSKMCYFNPDVVKKVLVANAGKRSVHHSTILRLLEKEFLGTNLEHQELAGLQKFVANNLLEHWDAQKTRANIVAVTSLLLAIGYDADEHADSKCQYCALAKEALINCQDQGLIYLKLCNQSNPWIIFCAALSTGAAFALVFCAWFLRSKKIPIPHTDLAPHVDLRPEAADILRMSLDIPSAPNNTPVEPIQPNISLPAPIFAIDLQRALEASPQYQALAREVEESRSRVDAAVEAGREREMEAQRTQKTELEALKKEVGELHVAVRMCSEGFTAQLESLRQRISSAEGLDKGFETATQELQQLKSVVEELRVRLEVVEPALTEIRDRGYQTSQEIAQLKDTLLECQRQQLIVEAAMRQGVGMGQVSSPLGECEGETPRAASDRATSDRAAQSERRERIGSANVASVSLMPPRPQPPYFVRQTPNAAPPALRLGTPLFRREPIIPTRVSRPHPALPSTERPRTPPRRSDSATRRASLAPRGPQSRGLD